MLIPPASAQVRAQTDIHDIDNDLRPLWFAGVDPSEVNFGLAYYGRTYTLADPSCATFNCTCADYGNAQICTNYPSILSIQEIETIINTTGSTPTLSTDSMVKYFLYDTNQWVGYDNDETIALKKGYAEQ
jgi:chitinase